MVLHLPRCLVLQHLLNSTAFVLFNAQVLIYAHPLISQMSAESFYQASCQTARDSDRRKGFFFIYHTYAAKHMWKQAGSLLYPSYFS